MGALNALVIACNLLRQSIQKGRAASPRAPREAKRVRFDNGTSFISLFHAAPSAMAPHLMSPRIKPLKSFLLRLHLKRLNMPPHAFGDSAFAVAAF